MNVADLVPKGDDELGFKIICIDAITKSIKSDLTTITNLSSWVTMVGDLV